MKFDMGAHMYGREASARKPYVPPKLKAFGSVGSLTQSGTGIEVEGVMMGMTQMNMNRRP